MLEDYAPYCEVARWLTKNGIEPGPYCRSKKWTGAMVRRLTHNAILKGERHRNKRVTIRINKTGRPKSIPAPPELLLVRKVPHLAFFEADRWDRLIDNWTNETKSIVVPKRQKMTLDLVSRKSKPVGLANTYDVEFAVVYLFTEVMVEKIE